VHNLEVWHDGIIHVLPEESCAAQAIEGDAVGYLDEVELLFLGEDVIDVWFEARVAFEDFGADGALGGGLDFL